MILYNNGIIISVAEKNNSKTEFTIPYYMFAFGFSSIINLYYFFCKKNNI